MRHYTVPTVDVRRVCPSCSDRARSPGAIIGDCLVCFGRGYVTLGPAALSIHEPGVVSVAVGMSYDNAAAEDLEQVFEDLHAAGIIYRKRPPAAQQVDPRRVVKPPVWVEDPREPLFVDVVLPIFEPPSQETFKAARNPLGSRRGR